MSATNAIPIPWWKEPTKDQWLAWVAAWLGWTLDAFDFTIFLLLMVPISKDFGVPLTAVAVVFTLTLWMRLIGATASGWLADRIGRKKPLMISIAWFSVCNLLAGLAPSFLLLLLFRTAPGHRHGRGMASRRGTGDGNLAAALARLHGLGAAGLLGPRRVALQRRLRPALRFDRLARPVADRRAARAADRLHPQIRQRAGGLDREPAQAARARTASSVHRCSASSSGACSPIRSRRAG